MTSNLDTNPGTVIHVTSETRRTGHVHTRGYVVAGDRRIPIWRCSANGNRACQGHGKKEPQTLRQLPCKRAGHPASERRVNASGHSYCTACARDGYVARKAA